MGLERRSLQCKGACWTIQLAEGIRLRGAGSSFPNSSSPFDRKSMARRVASQPIDHFDPFRFGTKRIYKHSFDFIERRRSASLSTLFHKD